MFPEIHFNFGTVGFDRVYLYFLPFVPGLVLAGGVVLVRPDLALRLPVAGPYIRLVVLLSVAYIVGLVLLGMSTIIAAAALVAWAAFFGRRSKGRDNLALSQSANWRNVAAKFLGPELTPRALMPTAEGPASTPVQQIAASFAAVKSAQQLDEQWKEWYDVLQEYVLRDVPYVSLDTVMLALAFQATGWALVGFLRVMPDARFWLTHVIAVSFIVVGVLIPWGAVSRYVNSDRLSYWDFTARLLAEVRKRDIDQVEGASSHETKT